MRDLWTWVPFGMYLLIDEQLMHVLPDGHVIAVKHASLEHGWKSIEAVLRGRFVTTKNAMR
jgi:hypothetical protein